MDTIGTQKPVDIVDFIQKNSNILWNLSSEKLTEISLKKEMGRLSSNNVLAIDTGKFTGRAPKDRFIVKDNVTSKTIDWGEINQPIKTEYYQELKTDILNYLDSKKNHSIIDALFSVIRFCRSIFEYDLSS